MVELIVKNLKEIESPALREEVQKIAENNKQFFEKLFKKYAKPVRVEIRIDYSSKRYKVAGEVHLISKKIELAEEHFEVLEAVRKLFKELKNAVKRQYEKERKEYKRKLRKES